MDGADVTSGGVATAASVEDEWLWGWDPTPGIASLWVESDGAAILWRRIGEAGQLIMEDARFRHAEWCRRRRPPLFETLRHNARRYAD
ncbi:MAG: hypothetical protein Q8K82_03940 [Gemmatimonadaceae bacterium]|nr:hypothetical protein [Gemmatimonadaceae bacterium]